MWCMASPKMNSTACGEIWKCWKYYPKNLRDWAEENGVLQPSVPCDCEQPYDLYYLIMPSFEERQALLSHLGSNGICAVLHLSEAEQAVVTGVMSGFDGWKPGGPARKALGGLR